MNVVRKVKFSYLFQEIASLILLLQQWIALHPYVHEWRQKIFHPKKMLKQIQQMQKSKNQSKSIVVYTPHKKWRFPLRISSVNETKSAVFNLSAQWRTRKCMTRCESVFICIDLSMSQINTMKLMSSEFSTNASCTKQNFTL